MGDEVKKIGYFFRPLIFDFLKNLWVLCDLCG